MWLEADPGFERGIEALEINKVRGRAKIGGLNAPSYQLYDTNTQ